MSHSALQPPAHFADFEFAFDTSLSHIFPNPPPLPSSADLFSPAETTDLLGFLDNFGEFTFDLNPASNEFTPERSLHDHVPTTTAPYSNPHTHTVPERSTSTRLKAKPRSASVRGNQKPFKLPDEPSLDDESRAISQARSTTSESSSTTFSIDPLPGVPATRTKPLLSSPQKRLNHIMSEQKRRNAIRDGYAQLIALLAPSGSPGIGMPTRGRPKGSGSRDKGQSKGKSGVLFRAVEYCRWLEEGRDRLLEEVTRVETAARNRHPS